MFKRGRLTTAPRHKSEDIMREEIARLETAIQQMLVLLKSAEPLTQKDHAVIRSLAWHLVAALHSRKPQLREENLDSTSFPKEA